MQTCNYKPTYLFSKKIDQPWRFLPDFQPNCVIILVNGDVRCGGGGGENLRASNKQHLMHLAKMEEDDAPRQPLILFLGLPLPVLHHQAFWQLPQAVL